MSKAFTTFIAIIIIMASLTYLSSIYRDQRQTIEECSQMKEALMKVIGDPHVTDTSLAEVIRTFNIKYPAIVHAQAYHESAGYTSHLFGHNRNLFGMKHPGSRVTTSLGAVGGYAYYATWTDSVIDYGLWFQTYASKCQTEDDVYKVLDSLYAEQPGYSGIIRDLAESYKKFYSESK